LFPDAATWRAPRGVAPRGGVGVTVIIPTPTGRPATRPRSSLEPAAVLIFPSAGGRRLFTVSRQPGLPGTLAALPVGSAETKYSDGSGRRRPVAEPDLDFWEFLPPRQARLSP